PSATCARSRRAACATCSSAARRSTIARKWKRSARRCLRSSGRTTSCRCSRRCAERCSRSATRSCSSGNTASADSTRSAFLPASGSQHLQPIADALRVLQTLHRRRNYRPVAETVQALLAETRAHVGIVLRTAGEQALANVLHLAQLAREYEACGGLSFRGFVDELAEAADTAQAGEAPILEEGSDGVRLMTVHKAKGLEFAIVILADLTCKLARADAGRWLDPDANRCALKLGGWSPVDLNLHGPEEAARDRAE